MTNALEGPRGFEDSLQTRQSVIKANSTKSLSEHVGADLPILYAVGAYIIRHLRTVAPGFSTTTAIARPFYIALLGSRRVRGDWLRPGRGRRSWGRETNGRSKAGGGRRHGQIEIGLVHHRSQSRRPRDSGYLACPPLEKKTRCPYGARGSKEGWQISSASTGALKLLSVIRRGCPGPEPSGSLTTAIRTAPCALQIRPKDRVILSCIFGLLWASCVPI